MAIYNNIKIGTIVILICIILILVKVTVITEPVNYDLYTIPFYIERKSSDAPRAISGVPLTIYQSWKTNEVTAKMRETIYSLLKMNPEFDYYLYSDEACRKFIEDNFNTDVLNAFDTLKPGAYKSDLWRYCILYINGGMYLDIKYCSVVPIVDIFEKNPTAFVKGLPFTCCLTDLFLPDIYNGFMISPSNNPIFKNCIDEIVHACKFKLYKTTSLDVTGPCLLLKIMKKYKSHEYIRNLKFRYEENITNTLQNNIYYNDTKIFSSYLEYRNENKFNSEKYYDTLWWKGDIYN